MRRLLEDGTYSSNYCNWQLKSLLHLEQIVITFRTLLHLGQNDITFRTLLHLGSFITFRPSTTRTLTRLELKVESKLDIRSGIPNGGTGQLGNSLLYVSYQHSCLISLQQ